MGPYFANKLTEYSLSAGQRIFPWSQREGVVYGRPGRIIQEEAACRVGGLLPIPKLKETEGCAMPATITKLPIPENLASRADQMFPKLTPNQIERVAAHGRRRQVTEGEVLVEP